MKKVLVTGGTVFVSKNVAAYYVAKGYDVYVLNRGTREGIKGTNLIKADRNSLGDVLKGMHFDVVFDITSYTKQDVKNIVEALDDIKQYVFISSSAIYPHNASQPFVEEQAGGFNQIWGDYGLNKLEAEEYLKENMPQAYIIRPPYLCGKMENLYRAAFVFECAERNRKFYLPKDGSMPLQFFDVEDLCRFMDIILDKKPKEHIFNVGNNETISVKQWVALCYEVAGKRAEFVNVYKEENTRAYFSFNEYTYMLDVRKQNQYLKTQKDIKESLKESYEYWREHKDEINRKNYIEYIDNVLK